MKKHQVVSKWKFMQIKFLEYFHFMKDCAFLVLYLATLNVASGNLIENSFLAHSKKPKVQLAVKWTWPIVVTWCENWSRWIGHRSEWHRKLARYQDHWSLQWRFKPIEKINHGELATIDTLPSKKCKSLTVKLSTWGLTHVAFSGMADAFCFNLTSWKWIYIWTKNNQNQDKYNKRDGLLKEEQEENWCCVCWRDEVQKYDKVKHFSKTLQIYDKVKKVLKLCKNVAKLKISLKMWQD